MMRFFSLAYMDTVGWCEDYWYLSASAWYYGFWFVGSLTLPALHIVTDFVIW